MIKNYYKQPKTKINKITNLLSNASFIQLSSCTKKGGKKSSLVLLFNQG